MKKYQVMFVALAVSLSCSGQKTDRDLTLKLQPLLSSFQGTAGIYVKNLKTGRTVSINADSIFPTASMIKVPISIGMFEKIEQGKIAFDTLLTYKDSLLYEGEDILGSFKNGEKISLSKVMMLMITTSDNTASLWCQTLAGTGTDINQWLERNGYVHTRVNSRTPGREQNRSKYGWGQTTPREMATLVAQIRDRRVVSPRASERIYRNMGRIFWDSEALSQIPPDVHTVSKSGAVNQSKSEVVLVNAPHGDYVFCIITKNQKDERWTQENEGYVLIRAVSRILYKHFEQGSKWEPPPNAKDWY